MLVLPQQGLSHLTLMARRRGISGKQGLPGQLHGRGLVAAQCFGPGRVQQRWPVTLRVGDDSLDFRITAPVAKFGAGQHTGGTS